MSWYREFLLILSSWIFLSCHAQIPSYIHLCHRNDPKLKECIIDSIETLRPKLKEGIPEINVPPIEPLPLEEIKLRSGPNSAQINANFTNVQVWGISKLVIQDIQVNLPKQVFLVHLLLPKLYFTGDYDINLNVLILKYAGQGTFSGNFSNYIIDLTLKYDLKNKNGKEYMNFPKVKLKFTQGKSKLFLDGLHNDDTQLIKGLSQVLDENTDIFLKEVLPVLEKGISERLTKIANNIVSSFPYDELFLL
ncbi:hypothetical protein ABEB36_013249 [Hypothenemus hampei]|uniref:Uncharacterized protein n=1 Tax=Hypothenemus hampei TaxID=57062 RepID=A0ABD1EA33_HYPHA